jgi:hypothetical protein
MKDVTKQPGSSSCASGQLPIGVSYRHRMLGDNEYPPDEGPATIADAVPLKRPLANWCNNGTMPLLYPLTALPRPMPICREDVDRQWENILFTTRWSIDRGRFHNRSLDFPAAIEVAIKNSRVSGTLRDIVAANIGLLSTRSWKEITERVLCGQFVPPSELVKPVRTRKSAGPTSN